MNEPEHETETSELLGVKTRRRNWRRSLFSEEIKDSCTRITVHITTLFKHVSESLFTINAGINVRLFLHIWTTRCSKELF